LGGNIYISQVFLGGPLLMSFPLWAGTVVFLPSGWLYRRWLPFDFLGDKNQSFSRAFIK